MAHVWYETNWRKFLRPVLILFVVSMLVFFMYLPNYTRLRKLREENARMNREIVTLKEEIRQLEENIRRAEDDPLLWERLAREKVGAVREGEIVVDIAPEGE